jgi:hypothetical protein
MELCILDRNQRKLPCAFLYLYTFAISTPDISGAKIAFYTYPSVRIPVYKLMASS